MSGGASVERGLAHRSGLRDIRIDGNVWGDVLRPQAFNVGFNVIGLVRADRDAGMGQGFLRQHLLRGRPFRRAAGLRDQPRDSQTVPILHGRMAHVAEFAFFAVALAVEAAVGIGRAGMRDVLACRAVEVLPSPSWSSFGLKLLWPAHASISVPSTEKCSSDHNGVTFL